MDKCPFCGGEAKMNDVDINDGESKNYFVSCTSCAAEGGWGKCKASAIRYWNLRYIPSEKSDE